MKKLSILYILILSACTSAQINQTLGDVNKTLGNSGAKPVTTAEVAEGLKEALIKGISNGADLASQLDGYFKNPEIKIPFPPEVKKVEDKLRQIGLGGEVDKFVMTLNRGAEDAAKEAKPIFITAIRSMTIEDAWAILRGQNDAARSVHHDRQRRKEHPPESRCPHIGAFEKGIWIEVRNGYRLPVASYRFSAVLQNDHLQRTRTSS